jgi:bifunctional oligoribonuclease and PAP phosphatase NrnA
LTARELNNIIKLQMQIKLIKETILQSQTPVIISTHQNPDGDALGSEVALAHALKKLGIDVTILNQDKTPIAFKFLEKNIKIHIPSKLDIIPNNALVIIVDAHDINIVGQDVKEIINKIPEKKILFINHHSPDILDDKLEYILQNSASSTGEIIYKIIKDHLNIVIDKEIAEAIYTAIISDTRSFRYSRTTSYSHQIASDLIEHGIKPEKIQLEVFGSNRLEQLQLLGYTLLNVKLSSNSKIAFTSIPLNIMEKYSALASETKGFVNHLLSIKGVEIAVLLREDSKDSVKISIRSKGNYPIYNLAEEYGGGGHKFAASFTSNTPSDLLLDSIIKKLEDLTEEK